MTLPMRPKALPGIFMLTILLAGVILRSAGIAATCPENFAVARGLFGGSTPPAVIPFHVQRLLNDNASEEALLYEKKNRYFFFLLFSENKTRKTVCSAPTSLPQSRAAARLLHTHTQANNDGCVY